MVVQESASGIGKPKLLFALVRITETGSAGSHMDTSPLLVGDVDEVRGCDTVRLEGLNWALLSLDFPRRVRVHSRAVNRRGTGGGRGVSVEEADGLRTQ
jgi:hypothetical protein